MWYCLALSWRFLFDVPKFRLERCDFQELEVLKISSATLRLLLIINCKWDGEYEVVLDVPNLELFHYLEDTVAYGYTIKNPGCVRKAYIDIGNSWVKKQVDRSHFEDIAHVHCTCSNIETLYLSHNSLQVLTSVCELLSGDEDELNVVDFFLKSAKVLRELEIDSDLSSEEQLNISKNVSLFPKCSTVCEIVFTSSEEGKIELRNFSNVMKGP
ncbi:hypothetical protein LguiB_012769 [Lonicera macranthoides]